MQSRLTGAVLSPTCNWMEDYGREPIRQLKEWSEGVGHREVRLLIG